MEYTHRCNYQKAGLFQKGIQGRLMDCPLRIDTLITEFFFIQNYCQMIVNDNIDFKTKKEEIECYIQFIGGCRISDYFEFIKKIKERFPLRGKEWLEEEEVEEEEVEEEEEEVEEEAPRKRVGDDSRGEIERLKQENNELRKRIDDYSRAEMV